MAQYEVRYVDRVRLENKTLLVSNLAGETMSDPAYAVYRVKTTDGEVKRQELAYVGNAEATKGFLIGRYLEDLQVAVDAQIAAARKMPDDDLMEIMGSGMAVVSPPQLAIGPSESHPGKYDVLDLGTGATILKGAVDPQAAIQADLNVVDSVFYALRDVKMHERQAGWRAKLRAFIARMETKHAKHEATYNPQPVRSGRKTITNVTPPSDIAPDAAEILVAFSELLADGYKIADHLSRILFTTSLAMTNGSRVDESLMEKLRELEGEISKSGNILATARRFRHHSLQGRRFMRLYRKYSYKGKTKAERIASKKYFFGRLDDILNGRATITRNKGDIQWIVQPTTRKAKPPPTIQ